MIALRRIRSTLVAVVVGAMTVLSSACQAIATVAIDAELDGSGTVTVTVDLDASAAGQLGDPETAFAVDDLRDAGWTIDGPNAEGEHTTLAASKPFANADDLPRVIAEVSGPDGPFQDVTLTHANGFAGSSLELSGRWKLTGSLDQFSDNEVAAQLDGYPLGRTPEEIAAALQEHPETLKLVLEVSMPGSVQASERFTLTDGTAASGEVLGTGAPIDEAFSVSTRSNNRSVVAWMIGAAVLMVGGLVVMVAALRRPQRRRGSNSTDGF